DYYCYSTNSSGNHIF
nr:immunoglobulin light chain junction region [Macaca mulatta]